MKNPANLAIISTKIIDQTNFEDYRNNQGFRGPQDKGLTHRQKEINTVLAILNKNLPIEDVENDMVISKIYVEDNAVMVYYCIVGDLYLDVYSDPEAKALIKENILGNESLKTGYYSVQQLGITGIAYLYVDKTGKEQLRIDLSAQEILAQ